MRVVAALLLVEISLAGAASPPPEAQSVLAKAAHATGHLPSNAILEMRGSVTAEERTGEYRETVRIRDGAFASHAQFKLFGEGDGYDGHAAWHEDRSGASHMQDAPFTHADSISVAWLKRRDYLRPGSAAVKHVAHEHIDGRPVTVLTMQPRGGNDMRLAFDDTTHLLVRVQRERPLNTVTEGYADYRPVGAAKFPFTTDIEQNGDHTIIHALRYDRLSSRKIGFSPPPPPHDMVMTGPATLPLETVDYAVAPAEVNGNQFNFVLDTGGHNILLPEFAKQLGLATTGQGTGGGGGPGRVTTSDTQVSDLKFGSATLTDQHFAVLDLGNGFQTKGQPPRAGILGLEIFERMAVTIDEPHNRLTIEPFSAVQPCRGDKVPLMFDDDQPVVRGMIDGIPALIGIDVGNGGHPIVLWRWAEAHHVADKFRNGTQATGQGVGGSTVNYRTPHHNIVVGHSPLRDVEVSYNKTLTGYFSSRTDSMNLGHTLLQKYAVRFDYSRREMCITKPTA